MNDLVRTINGVPMVSSRDVSSKFDRIHTKVMRDILKLNIPEDFRLANFVHSYYMSTQNKKIEIINMTKDGFVFLCMGFRGDRATDWKIKYINAFNSMESNLTKSVSVMSLLNDAVLKMEKDKDIASVYGKGLAEWKKLRVEHKEEVDKLVNQSQLLLGFE